MNKKKQTKNSGPRGSGAEAFEAVMSAIEECRRKPPYDYQRIIICHSNNPDLGPELARRSGAALVGAAEPLESRLPFAVLIVDNAGDCNVEALESIVAFVNRTRGVAVLLAPGQGFARWHDRWRIQADQIRRRTHLAIQFDR